MNETQLQIIVTAVNEAADQLAEVSGQLTGLGRQAGEAGTAISSSLTDAEQAAAEAAQATIDSWDAAIGPDGAIVEAAASAVEPIGASFASISESGLAAANSMSEGWQKSLQALQDDMTAADTTIVEGATAAGEAAGTAAGEGFGGYFKKMIIGYALEQIGSFLSGGIESAVSAASTSTNKISTLTTQIGQQKADIQVNEAAMQKWTGTTAEVNAAHEKAAANIAAEKVKIAELTQQLAPLMQAQSGLPGQITGIENAILGWIGAHKQLEGELQTFMTTLGPMFSAIGVGIIVVTLLGVALNMLDPVLLILIGAAVTIAVLTAVWTTFHTQIVAFFDDLNAKTGIITFLQQAWDYVVQEFEDKLLPALQKLWTALQPLMPLLQAMGVVIGVTLLGALVLLVDALTFGVTWFANALTAATNFATFLTNVLVAAINKVEDALNTVFSSPAFKAVSGLVGGAVSGISNVVGGILSNVTHVQDAIITPGGGVIQTDVADYLIATKNPGALVGAGSAGSGGIVVNITGTFLSQNVAQQLGNMLAAQLNQQLKLKIR